MVAPDPSTDKAAQKTHFLRGLVAGFLGFRELGVVIAAVGFTITFTLASSQFFTVATVGPLLNAATQYGLVGVGVTMLMISGEFDLSVGAVYVLTPLLMAFMFVNHHQSLWLSLVIAILASVGMGLLNGLGTILLKVPSFIVTLAAGLFWSGVSLNLTHGYPISYFGHSKLLHSLGGTLIGANMQMSVAVFWFLGVGVVLAFVLRKTRFGNWVFASGGNRLAARAMGVPTSAVKLVCFVLTSVLAGFAGIVAFASYGSAQPYGGESLNLTAIVVAAVGGAALLGGAGSILGAMLAAVVLGMTNTGLVLAGVSPTWFQSLIGFVLLFAVVVNLETDVLKRRFGVIR